MDSFHHRRRVSGTMALGSVLLALVLTLAGCSSGTPAGSHSPLPDASAATQRPAGDPCDVVDFGALPNGATCSVDLTQPAGNSRRLVRVSYTLPSGGWTRFLGPVKEIEEGDRSETVALLISEPTNVTIDACRDQDPAQPHVGGGVVDLAMALAALPPFEVVSPPEEVTAFGYSGEHLATRVPLDQPVDDDGFSGCMESVLRSWIAPPLSYAFYGYMAPGDTEEFWILDVAGSRVMISTFVSGDPRPELMADLKAVLDSVVIRPSNPAG